MQKDTVTINTKGGRNYTYQLAGFGERFAARLLDGLIVLLPSAIIPLIIPWLYWALQQSGLRQATIGQKALKIQVMSLDGKPVSFGQATGRFFGNFLNILTFFIGYFMFFFTDKRQCLHDIVAGTVVVKAIPPKEEGEDDIMEHLIEYN